MFRSSAGHGRLPCERRGAGLVPETSAKSAALRRAPGGAEIGLQARANAASVPARAPLRWAPRLLAALLLGTLPSGVAGDVVIASDPRSVMLFLRERGVPAELGRDKAGDPAVWLQANGHRFEIVFYDCRGGQACGSLQFLAGFRPERPTDLRALNAWNAQQRFARAFLLPRGRVRLSLDVHTGAFGIESTDFATLFETYLAQLDAFAELVGR